MVYPEGIMLAFISAFLAAVSTLGLHLLGNHEFIPILCNRTVFPFNFPIVTCPRVTPEPLCSGIYGDGDEVYILSLLQSHLCLSQTQESYLQRLSLYFLAVPIAPPDLLQLHEFFLATWSRKGRCIGRQGRSAPGVVLRCSGKWEEQGPRTYYWH